MAGLRKITLKWDIITGHLECDTSYVKREERVDVDLYVYESGTLTALATGWALNLTIKPLDLGDNSALVAITSWSASATTGLYQATAQAISSTELDTYLAANNSVTTDDEGPVEVDLDIYYTVSAAMKAKSDTRTLTLKPDVGRTDDGTPVGTAVSITSSGYTMSTARLLGRTTASAGAIEEISVGAGLTLSAGTIIAEVTQSEIDLKAPLASPTFTGTPGVSGGLSFISSVTPSTAFPALVAFGTFGATGTGVTLVGDGTYVGMANVVEGAGQVGISFRVNRAGSPSTGGTEALRISHTGTASFAGTVTASNLPKRGLTTADWTFPNEAYGEPPTGGVAVVAGTYQYRMHGRIERTSGADQIYITVNSNQSLGGPAISSGKYSYIFYTPSVEVGSGDLSAIEASPTTIGNPCIITIEGWVTFSAAGTFKWAAAAVGATDVIKLMKGAFIEMIPIV